MKGTSKFKIVETDYNPKDFIKVREELLNYEFFAQNLDTYRTCTKHKVKDEYRVSSEDNSKFILVFGDEKNAVEFLNDQNFHDYGLLETDMQEEIEKINPENIQEKSREFLDRFNKNFKLQVDYSPPRF